MGHALLDYLGRDRERFTSITEAPALIGTVPVTKASGRLRVVVFRRSCRKFARRTLQLSASQTRRFGDWAQAFYQKQRTSGHSHLAALRAFAYKWLKIILAVRLTGTLYDANIFANRRRGRTSVARPGKRKAGDALLDRLRQPRGLFPERRVEIRRVSLPRPGDWGECVVRQPRHARRVRS